MDVDTAEFQDWEVLHNSDSDSVEDMMDLVGIEGDSEGIIRSDYFSIDSQNKYSRTFRDGDVTEEGPLVSDNPNWIDPGSEAPSPRKELREFWSDSNSDRSDYRKFVGKNELGVVENAKVRVGSDGIEEIVIRKMGVVKTAKTQVGFDGIDEIASESENSSNFCPHPSGIESFVEKNETGIGNNVNSQDELEFSSEKEDADGRMLGGDKRSDDGDVVIGAMKSGGEGENRIMVWLKLPLELLKYCVIRVSPVWTVSVAAAVMGFVILGRRYNRMKRKSRSLPLKVTMDDKKVSQFMSRVARLNEAFSVVKRVPIIRPLLPAAGVTPWPVMTLR